MQPENKAVFLDRDGVLIHDVHYLSSLDQVTLYNDVPDGLLKLKANGFKLILVTNQSGIARGYFSEEFVHTTHDYLSQILEGHGVALDGIYFCPHHKDGNPPLNFQCECRKPAPGMVNKAVKEHGINCEKSYVVGDKISDMSLAANCGATGILVKTGYGEKHEIQSKARYPQFPVFNTFSEAVSHICQINSEKS